MIQQGDKVKFLNESGGGIITGFLKDGKALVETDEGFQIPYEVKYLVPVTPDKSKAIEQSPVAIIDKKVTSAFEESFDAFQNGIAANCIYLFFESIKDDDIMRQPLKVKLFNTTEFDVLFTMASEIGGEIKGIQHNKLIAGQVLELLTIKRSELDSVKAYQFQFMFYKSGICSFLPEPFKTEFKIKVKSFFSENSYERYQGLQGLALAKVLFDLDTYLMPKEDKNNSHKTEESKLEKKKQAVDFLEIDLHIEKLRADYKTLSPAEMLAIQMSFFKSKLNYAIQTKVKSIVFIHGVGAGVLKSELRKYLIDYPDFIVNDGSIFKYGNGATEVKLL